MKNLVQNHAPNLNYDLKKYYPDLYKRLWELKKNIIQQNIISNIRQGKAQGLYRAQADEQVIASLDLLLINGMINSDDFELTEMYNPHFHLQAVEYYVRGIATLAGIEEMERNLKQVNEQNT